MKVLTYPGLKPINWFDPPPATRRVASDLIAGDGKRFTGSMRTVCHWAWMTERLAHDHPKATLHMIQPCYNTGVPASAGTHDLDCATDSWIYGLSPLDGQRWLRRHGLDCWWRHTGPWAARDDWHYHGFPEPVGSGFATRVGIFLPGQLVDYHKHAFGLAGQHTPGSDHSWFPSDIHATAFRLGAFIRHMQEETMEYKDWSDKSKRQLAGDIADLIKKGNNDLLSTQLRVRNGSNTENINISVKAALARAANGVIMIRDKAGDIIDLIKQSDDDNS